MLASLSAPSSASSLQAGGKSDCPVAASRTVTTTVSRAAPLGSVQRYKKEADAVDEWREEGEEEKRNAGHFAVPPVVYDDTLELPSGAMVTMTDYDIDGGPTNSYIEQFTIHDPVLSLIHI